MPAACRSWSTDSGRGPSRGGTAAMGARHSAVDGLLCLCAVTFARMQRGGCPVGRHLKGRREGNGATCVHSGGCGGRLDRWGRPKWVGSVATIAKGDDQRSCCDGACASDLQLSGARPGGGRDHNLELLDDRSVCRRGNEVEMWVAMQRNGMEQGIRDSTGAAWHQPARPEPPGPVMLGWRGRVRRKIGCGV